MSLFQIRMAGTFFSSLLASSPLRFLYILVNTRKYFQSSVIISLSLSLSLRENHSFRSRRSVYREKYITVKVRFFETWPIYLDLISGNGVETRVLNVNNATFTYPSSPLLSQGGDVSGETMCYSTPDEDDARVENNETASLSSRRCRHSDATASNVCECVHVRYIPLGATVEIILLDQGNHKPLSTTFVPPSRVSLINGAINFTD